MRSIFRYASLSAICMALLMVSAAFGQPGAAKQFAFPNVVGWEKGETATYPSAELGYSVPYQSETGGTVTIYVYNGGVRSIADGIGDQNVKNEIKKAETDIKSYGDAGYYQNVKLIKSETATIGGTRTVLYSLFSMKIRGTDVDSEIYLFGYKNNFIKIRATRPKGRDGAANAEVDKLLKEVVAIFK